MKHLVAACLLLSAFACASAQTACEEHREKAFDSKSKLVPKCTKEGEYWSLQCFEGSPFCMCWRLDGSHITKPALGLKSCECIVHRDRVVRRLILSYLPQCEEDGTYSRIQCNGDRSDCWCVDENGKVDEDNCK